MINNHLYCRFLLFLCIHFYDIGAVILVNFTFDTNILAIIFIIFMLITIF